MDIIQALDFARDNQDALDDPAIVWFLEVYLCSVWNRIQQDPNNYIMTHDEFSLFNFHQNRFVDNEVAKQARARFWAPETSYSSFIDVVHRPLLPMPSVGGSGGTVTPFGHQPSPGNPLNRPGGAQIPVTPNVPPARLPERGARQGGQNWSTGMVPFTPVAPRQPEAQGAQQMVASAQVYRFATGPGGSAGGAPAQQGGIPPESQGQMLNVAGRATGQAVDAPRAEEFQSALVEERWRFSLADGRNILNSSSESPEGLKDVLPGSQKIPPSANENTGETSSAPPNAPLPVPSNGRTDGNEDGNVLGSPSAAPTNNFLARPQSGNPFGNSSGNGSPRSHDNRRGNGNGYPHGRQNGPTSSLGSTSYYQTPQRPASTPWQPPQSGLVFFPDARGRGILAPQQAIATSSQNRPNDSNQPSQVQDQNILSGCRSLMELDDENENENENENEDDDADDGDDEKEDWEGNEESPPSN
jgi:hypothetical protein